MAACPGCGVVSRRVHSRYQRQLADTASGGQEMLICLQARRFICGNAVCATTFAEQVPGLTTRYGGGPAAWKKYCRPSRWLWVAARVPADR